MSVSLACFLLYAFYGADKGMSFERNFFTASVVIDDYTLFGQKGKYFLWILFILRLRIWMECNSTKHKTATPCE